MSATSSQMEGCCINYRFSQKALQRIRSQFPNQLFCMGLNPIRTANFICFFKQYFD